MTRIIQRALAGLCAALLLIIAAELFHTVNQNDSASAVAIGNTTAEIKRTAPAFDIEAMVEVILERPLFSPSRQPPEVLTATHIEETLEKAPSQLHGRLAGMMISPGTREALFARGGQRPIAVKVGGEIDGWTIAAIEPDRVILSSNFGGTRTVRPTSDTEVVGPRARATEIALGMGPPTSSTTRGAVVSTPSARPSPQSSQVGRQVEQ
jgi:hypothetical protein